MGKELKKCKECKQERRVTQFSLTKRTPSGFERSDVCQVCGYDGLTGEERHKILREAYRHYLSFEQYVSDTGKDIIEYPVPKEAGSEERIPIRISFTDLQQALRKFQDGLKTDGTVLSKRKEQAFYLNVIRDMLQRDVAEIMGITTVSVGQYVEQACLQLADYYFSEDTLNQSESGV
jgi:DNA-directed RNA polymerase specialized sigma subunit